MKPDPLKVLAKTIGVRFHDEELLVKALTHPSYRHTNPSAEDNQRLEFLGDAVLHLILADRLYRSKPEMNEGPMTKARLAIECGSSLADKARSLGLNKLMRLGIPEAQIGMADTDKCMEDAFEALIGALWIDRGLQKCAEFVEELFGVALIDAANRFVTESEASPINWRVRGNPRSSLQEFAQKKSKTCPRYALEYMEGEPHERTFFYTVRIVGHDSVGSGSGKTKKDAQTVAAADLLDKLFAEEYDGREKKPEIIIDNDWDIGSEE